MRNAKLRQNIEKPYQLTAEDIASKTQEKGLVSGEELGRLNVDLIWSGSGDYFTTYGVQAIRKYKKIVVLGSGGGVDLVSEISAFPAVPAEEPNIGGGRVYGGSLAVKNDVKATAIIRETHGIGSMPRWDIFLIKINDQAVSGYLNINQIYGVL